MAKTVESTFDDGLDGWTLQHSTKFTEQWQATGGDPGGYLELVNERHGRADLLAPTEFLGDQHAFYGGTFSLDAEIEKGPPGVVDAKLYGAGEVIYAVFEQMSEADGWAHDVAILNPKHMLTASFQMPSKNEVEDVLGDLSKIDILCGSSKPNNPNGFDNIALETKHDESMHSSEGSMLSQLHIPNLLPYQSMHVPIV